MPDVSTPRYTQKETNQAVTNSVVLLNRLGRDPTNDGLCELLTGQLRATYLALRTTPDPVRALEEIRERLPARDPRTEKYMTHAAEFMDGLNLAETLRSCTEVLLTAEARELVVLYEEQVTRQYSAALQAFDPDFIQQYVAPHDEAFLNTVIAMADRISYKNDHYRLLVEVDKINPTGRVYIQVECDRPDSITKIAGQGHGGKAYLSEFMTEGEIFRKAFQLFSAYEEHECREFFRINGVPPFGPHIPVADLLSVADAESDAPPLGEVWLRAKVEALLEPVTYRPLHEFDVTEVGPWVVLTLQNKTPGAITHVPGNRGMAVITPDMSSDDAYLELFDLCMRYEETACRRAFQIDGKAPFKRGIPVNALLTVADRIETRAPMQQEQSATKASGDLGR